VVDLSHNAIIELSEVQRMAWLQELNLSNNQLSGAASFPLPTSLRLLQLQSNALTSISNLPDLPALLKLDASDNQLGSVEGVQRCPALTSLKLTNNAIAVLEALSPLNQLISLATLDLTGNQVTSLERYRLVVLYPLLTAGVSLDDLDAAPATAEEKVASLNLHGAADSALAAIRLKYFPPVYDEPGQVHSAATSLQSRYRGFKDRAKVKEDLKTKREEELSAIQIQCLYRKKSLRRG